MDGYVQNVKMIIMDEKFKDWLGKRVNTTSTLNQYCSVVNVFTKGYGKRWKSDQEMIDKMNNFIRDNPRITIRNIALKNLLEYMGKGKFKDKLIKVDKKPRKQIVKHMNIIQIRRLVKQTQNPKYKLLWMLLFDTGSRISAILNIKKKHILVDDDGMVKLVLLEKKTKQIRACYISETSGRLLKKYIKNKSNNDYLFVNETSNKNYYYTINRLLKKEGKKILGIDISLHWFRHSRIWNLYEQGHDILTIQKITGHKSLSTLQQYLLEAGMDSKKIIQKEHLWT